MDEFIDRDKLVKTEEQIVALLEFEKSVRYDEHAHQMNPCPICSLRKDINDDAPGYCKRRRELR
jgi:hypothetical protein